MSYPKVLQVTPVLLSGGAEHVASYLAHAFSEPGSTALISIIGGPYRRYLSSRKIENEVLAPTLRDVPLLGSILSNAKAAVQLFQKKYSDAFAASEKRLDPQKDLLASHCPDFREKFCRFLTRSDHEIIHFHGLATATLFQLAKDSGRSVVYGHHNILSQRHGPEDIGYLKSQLAYVDHVVLPSETARVDFLEQTDFPRDRASAIANPSFLSKGTRKRFTSKFTVGTASNLGPAKGIDTLLRAWALLRQRGNRIPLVIAGGGGQAVTHWRREAKALRIGADVRFLGNLTTERAMDRFYDTVDVIVIPSRTESFSLLMTEALSRGIPVVASDIPILKQVLGEAGLVFPTEDAAELAKCIEQLRQSHHLMSFLSNAGFELWQRRFSPEMIVRDYAAMYGAVLTARRSSSK